MLPKNIKIRTTGEIMKKLISAVMLSSLLLGACSEEAVKEEKPVTEQKAVPKEKTADQIAKAQEIANSSQYGQQVSEAMTVLGDKLNVLNIQNKKLSANPYIMKNQDWMADTVRALIGFNESIEAVKLIEAPVNPELNKAHVLMLKAMDEYQFVVVNYPKAIDNVDAALMQKCSTAFNTATDYLNEATEITKAYNKSN